MPNLRLGEADVETLFKYLEAQSTTLQRHDYQPKEAVAAR